MIASCPINEGHMLARLNWGRGGQSWRVAGSQIFLERWNRIPILSSDQEDGGSSIDVVRSSNIKSATATACMSSKARGCAAIPGCFDF